MKNLVKHLIYPFIFRFGLIWLKLTGKTLKLAYASFRFYFVQTNGRINDRLSSKISKKNRPNAYGEQQLFTSSFSSKEIADSIAVNGYFECDFSLPEDKVDELVQFALNTPCRSIDTTQKNIKYEDSKALFDQNHIRSPRYNFDSSDLVSNTIIQEIITNSFLNDIAARYLNATPILDVITMWWSAPFGNKASSQAAQMYHFDMDRIKFLKFFFYLTDVHTDNGPHCYIAKSHKNLPASMLKDMRIADNEVLEAYGAEAFKEFVGKRGTILAVDTRGLHKGKPLTVDNRLLFQIQFSNSLFGAPFDYLSIEKPIKQFEQFRSEHPNSLTLIKS